MRTRHVERIAPQEATGGKYSKRLRLEFSSDGGRPFIGRISVCNTENANHTGTPAQVVLTSVCHIRNADYPEERTA